MLRQNATRALFTPEPGRNSQDGRMMKHLRGECQSSRGKVTNPAPLTSIERTEADIALLLLAFFGGDFNEALFLGTLFPGAASLVVVVESVHSLFERS